MSKVMAHEEIAVNSVVKSLTQSVYAPVSGNQASYAIVHAEGGSMRYFVNGQSPTPASGILLEEGDVVELPSIYHIKDFRIVMAGTITGKITVTYEN